MKILMICTEKLPVPPVLGGAIQTYISGVLPHIGKHHDITVLGISDPSLPDQETLDGIDYVRVPGKLFDLYRDGVVGYIEKNQFDLIHVFNRPRLILPVRKAAPQAKITLSMHNDMFGPDKIAPEEAAAALEEISNIVTVSNYIGNVIKDLYPQAAPKLQTIYSGVDTQRFLPGNHPKMQKIRNELRNAHGLENKTVLLFAGRLSNNKGVDRLVRALPQLSQKFKDLALVIVGSNWFSQNHVTDYVAYVRALASKLPIPVVTTGFVAPSEIHNWFAAADMFVCTSQWQEPLARVHYEAMAAGLPIVTTARGGNPEVILPGENGLIVENPEDPDCFTEKISNILSSKPLMKKMGQKGRALAVSQYEWPRVASELLGIWERTKFTTYGAAPEAGTIPVVQETPSNTSVREITNSAQDRNEAAPLTEKTSFEDKKERKKPLKEMPVKQKQKKPSPESMDSAKSKRSSRELLKLLQDESMKKEKHDSIYKLIRNKKDNISEVNMKETVNDAVSSVNSKAGKVNSEQPHTKETTKNDRLRGIVREWIRESAKTTLDRLKEEQTKKERSTNRK
ncbi:glycosyltransferase family 4 protein [Bacillus infantis]|uniref:glycosyltransferase family 4 protein n=1 Tax=Bacillus infantis TaxID=324767 RepID=UPI001CD3C5B4|nr:glycosyltransferase family 4 protein [Bacillus infantis]MCA1035050.1 glycosyltransferase family 4 protein [Bacillus infantis]